MNSGLRVTCQTITINRFNEIRGHPSSISRLHDCLLT
jgi:hypothetical protein